MSDKPLVQQALASELAEILLTISNISSSLTFLRGFWTTLVREWNGIDRLRYFHPLNLKCHRSDLMVHRMDKYYMLVRRFVNASFRLLLRDQWQGTSCNEYNDILTQAGGPLWSVHLRSIVPISTHEIHLSSPDDVRVPASLTFHLADIYLEELNKSLVGDDLLPVPLSLILSPFFILASRTQASTTYKQIQLSVFEPLFSSLKAPTASEGARSRKKPRLDLDYPNLVSNCCFQNPKERTIESAKLRKALLRRLFEVASNEKARDSNRRKMYAFFKAAKEDGDDSDDELDV